MVLPIMLRFKPILTNFSLPAFHRGNRPIPDARGSANMTAYFSNFASSFEGGTNAPLQGVAFYSVEGIVQLANRLSVISGYG